MGTVSCRLCQVSFCTTVSPFNVRFERLATSASRKTRLSIGDTSNPDSEPLYRMCSRSSEHAKPVPLNPEPPFSHNWTGMVLRAFAAHPRYRKSTAAVKAARLLKTRFFQPVIYSAFRDADYWVKFQFPFWWNHLVAALDSISRISLAVCRILKRFYGRHGS